MSRVFDVDGKQMVFSFSAFDRIFKTYRKNKGLRVGVLTERLSQEVGVSVDTVTNWRKRKNGPIDIETIQRIASALEIKDYSLLFTETDGGNKMIQLTDRQKTAAKKIYDKCIWFLSEFDRTDGFNSYWLEFKDKGSKNPKEDTYKKVQGMIQEISLVYDQEYFDLKGHPIYNDFGELLSDGLYETLDDKLSYLYRFGTKSDGNPTVSEDYNKAMIATNSIIDKYL